MAVVYGRLPGFGLSEEGKRQAKALASQLARLGLAAVFTSPLERALQTAEIIASACGDLKPVVVGDLTEWELGSYWSGQTWEWIKKNRPDEWKAYITKPSSIRFIEETLEDLAKRMLRALQKVLLEAPPPSDRDVCVVSHADPLKALYLELTGENLDRLHSVDLKVGSAILLEVESLEGGRLVARHIARL